MFLSCDLDDNIVSNWITKTAPDISDQDSISDVQPTGKLASTKFAPIRFSGDSSMPTAKKHKSMALHLSNFCAQMIRSLLSDCIFCSEDFDHLLESNTHLWIQITGTWVDWINPSDSEGRCGQGTYTRANDSSRQWPKIIPLTLGVGVTDLIDRSSYQALIKHLQRPT